VLDENIWGVGTRGFKLFHFLPEVEPTWLRKVENWLFMKMERLKLMEK